MGQDLQLSVAIAQCASVVGDVQDNLRRAELLCQDARKQRAELILFPECHATGYSYRDLSWLVRRCAEPVDGPIAQRLIAMATRFSLDLLRHHRARPGSFLQYAPGRIPGWPPGTTTKRRVERTRANYFLGGTTTTSLPLERHPFRNSGLRRFSHAQLPRRIS